MDNQVIGGATDSISGIIEDLGPLKHRLEIVGKELFRTRPDEPERIELTCMALDALGYQVRSLGDGLRATGKVLNHHLMKSHPEGEDKPEANDQAE